MTVNRTKKGIPRVVVHPTYAVYVGDTKSSTEIHFCKEERKIFVDGVAYSSEKSCMCGSDSASTGGWYKIGKLVCNGSDEVYVNVICSIMETYNSAYSGLFVLQARHEASGSWSIKKLQWLSRIGFSSSAIKCAVDGNKAYLYAYKTTTQYSRLFIKVLTESNYANRIPYLFLLDNATPETTIPGGTTIAECCVPTASIADKVSKELKFQVVDSTTATISFDGSAERILSFPLQNVQDGFTGTAAIAFRRSNRTFCVSALGGTNIIDGTPYRIIKLENYDTFNMHTPQDGDILFLWVKNAISAVSNGAYPIYVPFSSAGENAYPTCKILYHGQSAGTPKIWATATALSAGFYMFVYREDVADSNSQTTGGWIFLYRNVSTS